MCEGKGSWKRERGGVEVIGIGLVYIHTLARLINHVTCWEILRVT